MYLDLPIPPHWPRWRSIAPDPEPEATAPAAPPDAAAAAPTPAPIGGEPDEPETARYTVIPDTAAADGTASGPGPGQPTLLIVSPLLPLPASLPRLLDEAVASEPDFRVEWRWPLLTPRAGPWELCLLLTVGDSRETGQRTGRVYAALDAGFGAFLIALIDREPRRLATRQRELCALLAEASLQERAAGPAAQGAGNNGGYGDDSGDGTDAAAPLPGSLAALGFFAPQARPLRVPPQRPPAELYLKDALFRHFAE